MLEEEDGGQADGEENRAEDDENPRPEPSSAYVCVWEKRDDVWTNGLGNAQ